MAEVASAFVSLAPSLMGFGAKLSSQIGGELDTAGKEGGKRFGSGLVGSVKGFVGPMAAALSAGAVVGFAKATVSAASDAQQSLGATETVFGKFADSVVKSSKGAATQFGLDANTYRENANVLGSLFKNQGVSLAKLGDKTKSFISIGSDLAATFGGTTTEAVEALSSALKGEFDPLERYGISLKQSSINSEAMRVAGVKTAKAFGALGSAQQKAAIQAATSNLIMQQSKSSLGAFGKESDTLAHQQQVLGAKFDNLKVTIGSALLPVVTGFTAFLSDRVMPALGSVGGFVRGNATAFKALGVVVAGVGAALAVHAIGTAAVSIASKVATVATKAWAAGQWLLNAALSANPIGLTIAAVAGLAAGVVLAYKKSETFRNIVTGAFNAVKAAASAAFGWVKSNWPLLLGIITGPIGLAVVAVVKNWDKIKAGAAAMKDAVVEKFRQLVDFIKAIPGKITGALGNVGDLLLNAGRSIIGGLLRGITEKFEDVKNFVGGIGSWIKDHKGPLSYDRKLLVPAGKAIIAGLGEGLSSEMSSLDRTLSGITSKIELAPLAAPSLSGVSRGGGTAQPIVVQVDGRELFNIVLHQNQRNSRWTGGNAFVTTN